MRTWGRGVGAVSLCAAALAAAHGCGGSQFTAAGDAGANDGSVADAAASDAAPDGPAQCILPPNGVGAEGDFCALFSKQFSSCGECEMCHQLDANECVALGDSLSPTFKSALAACQGTLGCGDVSTYAGKPCVRAQLEMAAKTATQNAVKQAYCTSCPTNVNECQSFFKLTGDAAGAGYGGWAMVVSDALAQQIITTCSSATSPHCDSLGYNVCSALVFCGNGGAPHSHCPMGLCK